MLPGPFSIHACAQSLHPFVLDSIQAGSVVDTDGWSGYDGLIAKGYLHEVTILKGKKETLGTTPAGALRRRASQAMVDGDSPRARLVISILSGIHFIVFHLFRT